MAYLLLHDNVQGDDGRAKTILEKMMEKFGTSSSFYLPINSRKTPQAPAVAEFWHPFVNMEATIAGGDLSRTISMASMASFASVSTSNLSDSAMHRRTASNLSIGRITVFFFPLSFLVLIYLF